MNKRPRPKLWPRGPLNTQRNCVAFHILSFPFLQKHRSKTSKLMRSGRLHFRERELGVNICSGSFVVNLFKQKVISQKINIFAPMTLHSNIFYHRLSDHLHCTNRPFTYVLRKDISTLSQIKTYIALKKCYNEISRKSNLNRITWPKFCDGNFKIFTPINCSTRSSGQQRCVWSKTDTLTITTNTSQPIVTSAHYTVIAKALDCEEHLATNLLKWPWSLSVCALKNSQLLKVSWRRIFCIRKRWWLSPGPYLEEYHASCYVLSLRFSSNFLASNKCKAVFAVASYRTSPAQFL